MQELDPESRSDPTANRTGSKDSIRSQSPFTCSIQYGMRTQIDLNPPCKRSKYSPIPNPCGLVLVKYTIYYFLILIAWRGIKLSKGLTSEETVALLEASEDEIIGGDTSSSEEEHVEDSDHVQIVSQWTKNV